MALFASRYSLFILAGIIIASASLGHATENWGSPSVTGPLYHFSGKLFAQLSEQYGHSNLVVSPLSIHKALNVVLLGSDDGSRTKRELLDTIGYSNVSNAQIEQFHLDYSIILTKFNAITRETLDKRREFEQPSERSSPFEMAVAGLVKPTTPLLELFNLIVTKNKGPLNANYQNFVEKYYHASIRNVDDAMPQSKADLLMQLNNWARKAEFETPIIKAEDLEEEFEAILLSAIKIEAFWFKSFDEYDLKKVFYNFGLQDGAVGGKMLNHDVDGKFIEFTQAEGYDVNYRVVEVPLVGELTFTIFEPIGALNSQSDGQNHKLNRLIDYLLASDCDREDCTISKSTRRTNLEKTLQVLAKSNPSKLNLSMPKFRLENELKLVPALKALGLRDAFDRGLARISHMTSKRLYIDDFEHLAMLDVTKDGIKAAAITTVNTVYYSALPKYPKVIVERPFVFLFRYNHIPLFIGKLTNLN